SRRPSLDDAMTVRRAGRLAARALLVLACVPHCRGTPRNALPGAVSAVPASAQRSTATALDVCVGEKRSCALASDGRVACWGDNRGQWLSETSEPQLAEPTELAELAPAASLQCTSEGVCVRTRAGGVSCRVENARGVLRPPLPGPALDFVALGRDGCAILEGKKVVCFDLSPPLGNLGSNPPVAVEGASGASAFFASGSASRACVKREGAPAVCFELVHPASPTVRVGEKLPPEVWLTIEHLQVLPADAPAVSPSPQPPVPARATRFALSEHHGCAIVDGKVECWGRASDGQLGDGTRYLHPAPAAVPGLTDVVSLSVANTAACALKRGGALVCWGGYGDQGTAAFAPTEVATSEPFTEVALTPAGSSALLCARGASGWQCRVGDTWRPLQGPERDSFAMAGLRVNRVASDGRCAVGVKGQLYCSTCRACSPAQAKARLATIAGEFVGAAATVFDPVQQAELACALTKDAKVRCFQLMDAAFERPKSQAVPWVEPSIEALNSIVQLEAAGSVGSPVLACALSAAGAVSCWGSGESGQLGAPPIAHRSSAELVPGLPRVVQIGVGIAFACARAESGAVLCWGSNRDGSAPDGSPAERTEPVTLAWPSSVSH
ncbi:MAG TPA: hypothetical protein VGC79_07235, partial [Polyangiaceae bacterium]